MFAVKKGRQCKQYYERQCHTLNVLITKDEEGDKGS